MSIEGCGLGLCVAVAGGAVGVGGVVGGGGVEVRAGVGGTGVWVGMAGVPVGTAATESGTSDATVCAVDVAVGSIVVPRHAARRPAAMLITRPTNERREMG